MKYRCTKGFTLKTGKHYGFGETISEDEYNKLNEDQKAKFVEQKEAPEPEFEEPEDTEGDEEK
jgi:hypothetical protein